MNVKPPKNDLINNDSLNSSENQTIQYINLKLAAMGCPYYGNEADSEFLDLAKPLITIHRERSRILSDYLCPIDRRIQNFLDTYFKDIPTPSRVKIPANTFILDRPGLARIMSLPPDRDEFISDIVSSYRVKQGILHNPQSDRRTTQGVFHVAEGGYPIPDDKKAVPKAVFQALLLEALKSPKELLKLPFTASQKSQAELFVSLMLRPIVCPEVPGFTSQKTMEIRFFAPGSMIGNLDFVESIFGNAGSPHLPENDAALDIEHWTGHTGCVILAPHLIRLRKKDLGLPHLDQATQRQKRDGMCWKNDNELYNDGAAFKVTCRDQNGVIVTVIADNYFGYCKKEVKTQISFSANLFGLCEEEHAGGAIASPSYNLGESFSLDETLSGTHAVFSDLVSTIGEHIEIHPEGHATDKNYPNIIYVPETSFFDLPQQSIFWEKNSRKQKIKLLASHTYILPSGYRVHIKKKTAGHSWHLVGTVSEGTQCHKPCTVSGGGKSEISKSIMDAMIQGPIFTADFQKDFDQVERIMQQDYAWRFRDPEARKRDSRPVLSPKRSLGSVIKLLTPSQDYCDDYNAWLGTIPPHIKEIVFVVKSLYQESWGKDWRKYFGVDLVNGHLGNELKFGNQKLVANYLRLGREADGSWRIYRVRPDYVAAEKVQTEDDITVSITVPSSALQFLGPASKNPSLKFVLNCEQKLFQRPDDAIYRGYDKQAEKDIAGPDVFLSNFEPLEKTQAREIADDAVGFDQYTKPMHKLLEDYLDHNNSPKYIVSSAHPRIVDGKPSKNPRYLQNRPDLLDPKQRYLVEISARLFRKIPANLPVHLPVSAVLPGRRNNPADLKAGIPPLAVYSPIHYQEYPELFMDFISSLTGKSPSTTGFGSEGALTKGPFNALLPVIDLNNALLSYILTNYHGFSSAAGYVGPKYKIDHDVSLLIPEIWCRMTAAEREPRFLIENGYLEKLEDFQFQGRAVQASLLGYRITDKFVRSFLGRIFNSPNLVMNEEILAPEKQDLKTFCEAIESIVETHQRVALQYFNDKSVDLACPPLKCLLHLMAHGHYEGKNRNHPEIRALFDREKVLQSGWYQKRLETKKQRDLILWTKHQDSLENFISGPNHAEAVDLLELKERLKITQVNLQKIREQSYIQSLVGTIGTDPAVTLS